MKDKIISFLLMLIILTILGAIGIFGYIIYNEIMATGMIQINFEGETGFPTIEYTPSNNNSLNVDSSIFDGVEGSAIGTTTTTVTGPKQSRHLYEQLDNTAKIIYNKIYENKENLKTGIYKLEFGNEFQSLLSQENGDVQLKKQYQSAIEALIYENPDVFLWHKLTEILQLFYNEHESNNYKV